MHKLTYTANGVEQRTEEKPGDVYQDGLLETVTCRQEEDTYLHCYEFKTHNGLVEGADPQKPRYRTYYVTSSTKEWIKGSDRTLTATERTVFSVYRQPALYVVTSMAKCSQID